MSTAQGSTVGGSDNSRPWGASDWRSGGWRSHSCGGTRWSMVEILAIILGFVLFWPIGLAILGFKIWQAKSGYRGDLTTAAQEKWRDAQSAMQNARWGSHGFAGFKAASTGNLAFDDWRAAEIARLDEERRKLEEAHREFASFVENIRRAKDREEFERFMSERRNRSAGEPEPHGPAA